MAAIRKDLNVRRYRKIPVDPVTLNMLEEYLVSIGLSSVDNNELIFKLNRHRAWQIIRDTAEKAGLSKLINTESGKEHFVSPHKLRDAFAVRAVKQNDSGDGLRLLQEHLGHASFNTTAKYRKISGEEHQQWYRSLWKT